MPDATRAPCLFDRQAAGAFFACLTFSAPVFGRKVLAHPATVYVGRGPDPQPYISFMAWWALAISQSINPFLTKAVWAPSGVNLA